MMNSTKHSLLGVDGMTGSSGVRHVEGALREGDGVGAAQVKLRDGTMKSIRALLVVLLAVASLVFPKLSLI